MVYSLDVCRIACCTVGSSIVCHFISISCYCYCQGIRLVDLDPAVRNLVIDIVIIFVITTYGKHISYKVHIISASICSFSLCCLILLETYSYTVRQRFLISYTITRNFLSASVVFYRTCVSDYLHCKACPIYSKYSVSTCNFIILCDICPVAHNLIACYFVSATSNVCLAACNSDFFKRIS